MPSHQGLLSNSRVQASSDSPPPPLSRPIVDPDTGYATPEFGQFLQRQWSKVFGRGGIVDSLQVVNQQILNATTQITQTATELAAMADSTSAPLLQLLIEQQGALITELRIMQLLLVDGFQSKEDPDRLRDDLTPRSGDPAVTG